MRRHVLLAAVLGIVLLLILVPVALTAPPRTGPSGAPAQGRGTVDVPGVRVITGDTLESWIDGHRVGIGLLGVRAPQGNTACGREAITLLRKLVKGGLRLEEDGDPSLAFDGPYRRMYRAVNRQGQNIEEELVRAGVAQATGRGAKAATLNAAEADSRAAGRGCLWNSSKGATLLVGMAGEEAPLWLPVAPPPAFATASVLALPAGFTSEVAASGATNPTAFVWLPDGRILISEKGGTVRVFKNGALLPTPLITLPRVNDHWDRGLLSLAADPNFAQNGFLYLAYTYENNANDYSGTKTARVTRVTVTGDVASPASEVVVLGKTVGSTCNAFALGTDCLPSDSPSHTVGTMKFAPDGSLFVTVGDSASFTVVEDNALRAQNLDSLAGKVLHITTTGAGLATNPFWNGTASANRSKVWALGVRNSYRFNLRPGSNQLYLGDVGWDSWEEINVGIKGSNMGWPCYEGPAIQSGYEPKAVCQALYAQGAGATVAPLVSWTHNLLSSASTGGAFYSGTAYPAPYRGAYFYGDYAQSVIRYVTVDASDALTGGPTDFATAADGPVDIEMGPDGSLYYLAINTGELRRIRYTAVPPPPGGTQYLSDLGYVVVANGWGPAEKDRSNGEAAAGDGRALTLNGTVYGKGLGVHAASEVTYGLAGACSGFTAQVGVDDEVASGGSVVFQVWADGAKLYDSGPMTAATATKAVSVALAGKGQLRLVVTDGGDGPAADHADWADAKLACGGADTTAPTVAGTSPAAGATGVAAGAPVAATFSEGMDAATLTAGTFTLARQGGGAVAGAVSYDAATLTATLRPGAALAAGGVYTATVKGGAAGAKDAAGNPLAADKTWSFTVAALPPPTVTISAPNSTLTYKVGDVISYAGSAVDGGGAAIPASGLSWQITINHCPGGSCHTHPFVNNTGPNGTFTIPDHGDESYFTLSLTATDGNGQTATKSVDIRPKTIQLTLATAPAGLQVVYGGTAYTAPATITTIVGSVHTILAPSPQTLGGTTYTFGNWSDAGAQQHDITLGATNATYTATFTTAPPPPGGTQYLSDLGYVVVANGWGPAEKDRSNGEAAAGDGRALTLNGTVYGKGLGVHAASEVTYGLAGACSGFTAQVGVDDEVASGGSVVFQVWADGAKLYDSGPMTAATATKAVSVALAGKGQLRLVVTDGGDGPAADHADWADAKLACGGADTTAPTVAGTSPAAGATGVAAGAPVAATFSEGMDAATLTAGTFTLARQGGGAVAGAVSYDAATLTATLRPGAALAAGGVYTATVKGGAAGAKDAAGNPLAADKTWSFTVATTSGGTQYLSDLGYVVVANGWGPAEKDRSNGEAAAGDGRALTLNGTVYGKGLGVHAASEVTYGLAGACSGFTAQVGVDDEVASGGSVVFQVWADGAKLYDSGPMTAATATKAVSVALAGKGQLRLVVTDGGDGPAADHADWADAKLACTTFSLLPPTEHILFAAHTLPAFNRRREEA